MTTTAVLPARNEASRVAETVRRTAPHVDEVLVVDDGSADDTAAVARAAGARVVSQPPSGYIAALKAGFASATSDVVVVIDADGEFEPDDIPRLLEPIRQGRADMVQGRRPRIPRPSERVLTGLAGCVAPVGDSGTGFRAIRTELARRLTIPGTCICGILTLEAISLGARVEDVPVALRETDKRRRIAYGHVIQLFRLLPWLVKGVGRLLVRRSLGEGGRPAPTGETEKKR